MVNPLRSSSQFPVLSAEAPQGFSASVNRTNPLKTGDFLVVRLSHRPLAAAALVVAALLLLVASAAGKRSQRPAPRCTGIVSWLGPVHVKDGKIVGRQPAPVTHCVR
jgi:hypothetical protein